MSSLVAGSEPNASAQAGSLPSTLEVECASHASCRHVVVTYSIEVRPVCRPTLGQMQILAGAPIVGFALKFVTNAATFAFARA
jgi:hypothetical protein